MTEYYAYIYIYVFGKNSGDVYILLSTQDAELGKERNEVFPLDFLHLPQQ